VKVAEVTGKCECQIVERPDPTIRGNYVKVKIHSQPMCAEFNGYSAELTFCDVDPELFAMLSGQEQVVDANGDVVGFRMSEERSGCDYGFALEVWAFEGSLSQKFGFQPTGAPEQRYRFLRNENGLAVYLDLETGTEVYAGRTKG